MNKETDHLQPALRYLRRGWSVIPLDRNKRPLIPEWTTYQGRQPTKEEVMEWWGKWPDANIGIVTGKISGVVVLDADSEKAHQHIQERGMPPTPQAGTGKGTHFYFKYPGHQVHNKTNRDLGLDVRGDGGYVMAPPSVHPNGKRYEWAPFLGPEDVDLDPLPPWALDYIGGNGRQKEGKPQGWQLEALQGVPEGSRNQTAASLAGHYITKGLPDEEVAQLLLNWNKSNKPPLPEDELLTTIRSVRATHNRNHPKEDPLRFPDIMGGLAGEFAHLYSRFLEVPKHFFFMAFLVCLGTILAGKVTLASQLAPQPRLYVILLGESADDRKSTAINTVVEFFKEALPKGFSVHHGVGSAEGLQKALQDNGNLLLCLDEFKQFISKCRIDASVLLPCVNTLFESNSYQSKTKTSDIRLEKAYLSILAASTIQTYENVWDSQFLDIGFTNRLFLVPGSGERKFPFPPKVPDQERNQLRDRLLETWHSVEGGLELGITPDALTLYDQWYMGIEKSVHSKRLDTYAMRFMGLLAVNDGKREVDEETVRKVIALCDWQLEVRRLHDPIDAEGKVARMEEKIRRALAKGPKSERELQQRTNYRRDGIWTFRKAKENLEAAKEILWDSQTKRWRRV